MGILNTETWLLGGFQEKDSEIVGLVLKARESEREIRILVKILKPRSEREFKGGLGKVKVLNRKGGCKRNCVNRKRK